MIKKLVITLLLIITSPSLFAGTLSLISQEANALTSHQASANNDGRIIYLSNTPAPQENSWDIDEDAFSSQNSILNYINLYPAGYDSNNYQLSTLNFTANSAISIITNSNDFSQHIFFYNLTINTNIQIGTQFPQIKDAKLSDNGRYAIFSAKTNTSDDRYNTYRYDSLTGLPLTKITTISNILDANYQTKFSADHSDISDSGELIVFASRDKELHPTSSNDSEHIFLYNDNDNSTTWITQRASGFANDWRSSSEPVISADGNFIFFCSYDSHLVDDDNNLKKDIFCYDINSGLTSRISIYNNEELIGDCHAPTCSSDGRFITFLSEASNLPNHNYHEQVYLLDRADKSIICLSLDNQGNPSLQDCLDPQISPNGRYITFAITPQSGSTQHIYLYDRGENHQNHTPQAISTSSSCQFNSNDSTNHCSIQLHAEDQDTPQHELNFKLLSLPNINNGYFTDCNDQPLTHDQLSNWFSSSLLPLKFIPFNNIKGTIYLTYQASDNITYSNIANLQLTVTDYTVGTLSIASFKGNNQPASHGSPPVGDYGDSISISADGRFIAFASADRELSSSMKKGIFIHDQFSQQTRLAYEISDLLNTTFESFFPTLAANGNAITYQIKSKLYWQTINLNGTLENSLRCSQEVNLNTPPSISADGKSILFLSKKDQENEHTLYLWQPYSNTLTEIIKTIENIIYPQLSADGRFITFSSKVDADGETTLANSAIWLQDLTTNQWFHHTIAGQDLTTPSISEHAKYLAFSYGTNLKVININENITIYDENILSIASRPLITPSGRFIYLNSDKQPTNLENELATCNNNQKQAYRLNIQENTLRPISINVNGTNYFYGNQDSYKGQLNSSGRYATFITKYDSLFGTFINSILQTVIMDMGEPTNQIPTCELRNLTIQQNQNITINLEASDYEKSDPIFEIVNQPQHGNISPIKYPTIGQNITTIIYTPNSDFRGRETFSYRCFDGQDWSEKVTITIKVMPNSEESSSQTFNLANFADISTLTGELTYQATLADDTHASITINNGTITYNPSWSHLQEGETAHDTIDYIITGDNGTITESINITIIGKNNSPIITQLPELLQPADFANISITWDNTPESFLKINDDDNDENEITISITTLPLQGTLYKQDMTAITENEPLNKIDFPITYHANNDAKNLDSFTIQANDNSNTANQLSADSATIIYLYNQTTTIIIAPGWNLIALPFTPNNSNQPTTIFLDDQNQPLSAMPIWSWNAQQQIYQECQNLHAGEVIWLFSDRLQETLILINGTRPTHQDEPIQLLPGWNTVGAIGYYNFGTLIFDPKHPINNQELLNYFNGTYHAIDNDQIQRNKGYWIYHNHKSTITLPLNRNNQ